MHAYVDYDAEVRIEHVGHEEGRVDPPPADRDDALCLEHHQHRKHDQSDEEGEDLKYGQPQPAKDLF